MDLNTEDLTLWDWLEIVACAIGAAFGLWVFIALVFVLGGPH